MSNFIICRVVLIESEDRAALVTTHPRLRRLCKNVRTSEYSCTNEDTAVLMKTAVLVKTAAVAKTAVLVKTQVH